MTESTMSTKKIENGLKRIAMEDNEAGSILRGYLNIPSIEAAREIFSSALNESH